MMLSTPKVRLLLDRHRQFVGSDKMLIVCKSRCPSLLEVYVIQQIKDRSDSTGDQQLKRQACA